MITIAGGTVGGVAGITAAGTGIYLFLRRRRSLRAGSAIAPQYGEENRIIYFGNSGAERIHPFPFSAAIGPTCNSQVLREKDLQMHNTMSLAQTARDERTNETGDSGFTRGLRRDDADQADNEPIPSNLLETTVVDRERALRDEMEILRREVRMLRHGEVIGPDTETPPPSYRDDS